MMDQLPIRRCQYCGSDGLNLDWQHGEGIPCAMERFRLWRLLKSINSKKRLKIWRKN